VNHLRLLLVAVLLLLLSACQWWRPEAVAVPVVVAAPPAAPRDVLAELRAAAAQVLTIVEIVPVENPAIAVLLSGARMDLDADRTEQAQAQLQVALEMEPENPRVLQEMAELQLYLQRYAQASALAKQSFARSSQLGELCARSWLTLAEVSLASGLDPFAERQQAQACGIKPLPRL
jgi:tetratricopeptide (TPR) repeat protein